MSSPFPSPEPLRFRCPRCFHHLKANADKAGSMLRCPACFIDLRVPYESTIRTVEKDDYYQADEKPQDVRNLEDRKALASFQCPVCCSMLSIFSKAQLGTQIVCPECESLIEVPWNLEESIHRSVAEEVDRIMEDHSRNPAAAPPPDIYEIVDPNTEYYFSGGSNRPGVSFSDGTFPVYCLLCNTMMRAMPQMVGQMLTCPDCGRETPVKEPEKIESGPFRVANFEGANLYGAEEKPEIHEDDAAAGRLVPVVCSLCNTRMYARENEIGQYKTCPDCGTKTQIKDVPREQRIVASSDIPDYEIKAPEIKKTHLFRIGADYREVEGSLDLENQKLAEKRAKNRAKKK